MNKLAKIIRIFLIVFSLNVLPYLMAKDVTPRKSEVSYFFNNLQQVNIRDETYLKGCFISGGLILGYTNPNEKIIFNNNIIYSDKDGRFVLGIGHDFKGKAKIIFIGSKGRRAERVLMIKNREYKVSIINGLPPSKVSTYTKKQLAKIKNDKKLKNQARSNVHKELLFDGTFQKPVSGKITSPWGARRILNGKKKKPHFGLDMKGAKGTSVMSPASGIVTLAQPDMYFEGGLIFIDHGGNLESAFMHLSKIQVKVGDKVNKGDIIGQVGSTGRSTGPHLHWGLKWKDTPIDPQIALLF